MQASNNKVKVMLRQLYRRLDENIFIPRSLARHPRRETPPHWCLISIPETDTFAMNPASSSPIVVLETLP
jgi:hypothetical protein